MSTKQSYYPVQTGTKAIEPTKQLLADIAETYGSIPSVLGVMANSSIAIESYQRLSGLFSLSDFKPLEVHGVYLTIICEEGKDLGGEHVSLLNGWFGIPLSVTEAIIAGNPTGNRQLDVLLETTRQIVQEKGTLFCESKKRFIAAGYKKSQIIDLLVPAAMKTMTSYLERLNE